MTVVLALMVPAAAISLWAGFKGHTPPNFPYFQVDHHDDKAGELTWNEK